MEEQRPDQEPPVRRKLSALEVRNKYGIRVAIILPLFLWFAYDGWINAKFQAAEKSSDMWFNRIGAIGLGVALAFNAVMAGSAALTLARQQPQPPPPDSPPSPP